jgi:hypothetical protein
MKKPAVILVLFLMLCSCRKDKDKVGFNDCFDEQLYEQHKNDICPDNCPGVIGCDGRTYCNACYAIRQGIKVKE